jgi:hypothetical protein
LRVEFDIVEVEIRLVGDAFVGVERPKAFDDYFFGFRRREIGEKVSVICGVVLTAPTRCVGH